MSAPKEKFTNYLSKQDKLSKHLDFLKREIKNTRDPQKLKKLQMEIRKVESTLNPEKYAAELRERLKQSPNYDPKPLYDDRASRLQRLLDIYDDIKTSQSKQIESLEAEISLRDQMKDENYQFRLDYNQCEKNFERLKNEKTSIEQINESMETEIAEYEKRIETLIKKNEELQNRVNLSEDDLNNVHKALDETKMLREEKQHLQMLTNQLKQKLNEKDMEFRVLQEKMQKIKQQESNKSSNSKKQNTQDTDDLVQEIIELQIMNEKLENMYEDISKKFKESLNDLSDYEEKNADLRLEFETLQDTIEKLQDKNDELKAKEEATAGIYRNAFIDDKAYEEFRATLASNPNDLDITYDEYVDARETP